MIRKGVLTENDHESAETLTDLLCYLKYAATPIRPPFRLCTPHLLILFEVFQALQPLLYKMSLFILWSVRL